MIERLNSSRHCAITSPARWLTLACSVLMSTSVWVFSANAQAATTNAAPTSTNSCVAQLVTDPDSGLFITSDTPYLSTQADVNCYAWQMFIGMNWPVDPAWPAKKDLAGEPDRKATFSQWGVPADPSKPLNTASVWGSYKSASTIFLPDAKEPEDWGVTTPKPASCPSSGTVLVPRVLSAISKSGHHQKNHSTPESFTTDLGDKIMEATGGWLTDQAGNLVYFEQKVGKAEFDYIKKHKLYDADQQKVVATDARQYPAGINLPTGKALNLRNPPSTPQHQDELGSFELKAAWRILTGNTGLYHRYVTSSAWVYNPITDHCTEQVVGLVGLHIIHKTERFPDFVWATFEQVDNVPDSAAATTTTADNTGTSPQGFSFNNPDCAKTGEDCTPNQARIDCQDGKCKALYPLNAKVQVTRVNPIAPSINDLNTAVQQWIGSATANQSVFQYYQLVNVLWDGSPNLPAHAPGSGATIPLAYGSFESTNSIPVANTTLETYAQEDSCNSCHQKATIAGSDTLASDFSFLLRQASSPAKGTTQKETRAK
ncbi:hypothetical protein ACKC9G_14465 [Pokkaliibacter sp. CJK22405]|uniref:hypothetical protein n=1 Tax=Pokkaliibacter sp. CJK22405 TaxID=3384615 RepID=UPI0039856680